MKFILLLLLALPLSSYGHIAGVYDLWGPEKQGEPYLVLATNGRVHEAYTKDKELIKVLQKAKISKSFVQFDFIEKFESDPEPDRRMIIEKATLLAGRYDDDVKNIFLTSDEETYSVKPLPMEEAKQHFATMREGMREKSQCYNRAHIWSYELDKYYNVKTMKNWMFFTRRYIREYNFYWWFHVTPYTLVKDIGQVSLDRRYMATPTPIEEWKNYFMRNNASCPIIKKYSSFRDNQESEYCYWIQTNMYFWQPYQIERLEEGYDPRSGWIKNELDIAYGDAL